MYATSIVSIKDTTKHATRMCTVWVRRLQMIHRHCTIITLLYTLRGVALYRFLRIAETHARIKYAA